MNIPAHRATALKDDLYDPDGYAGRYYAEEAQRRELCNATVTLNGNPAVVCGARRRFATVAALPDGEAYEFSWETVARVINECGGAFHS